MKDRGIDREGTTIAHGHKREREMRKKRKRREREKEQPSPHTRGQKENFHYSDKWGCLWLRASTKPVPFQEKVIASRRELRCLQACEPFFLAKLFREKMK